MATTTNYGWTTPDDTALVKDGAAAIRTLGSSVDTTTKALNPSTTLGDIEYRSSTANTNTRLGIGSTGQVLTVSGGVPAWATPATPSTGANWSLVNSGGTALSGAATVTISGISSADKIMILVKDASTTGSNTFAFRLNTDTASNYYRFGGVFTADSSAAAIVSNIGGSGTNIPFALAAGGSSIAAGYCLISGCNASGVKVFNAGGGSTASGINSGQNGQITGGYYDSSSTISSVSVFSSSTNFDAGTVYVYTSA